MRISSGIAEIGIRQTYGGRIVSEKSFVWPLYNAGRVEKIHGVTRQTDSNAIYSKPSPDDRAKILSFFGKNELPEYSASGEIKMRASGVQPGVLFDAII